MYILPYNQFVKYLHGENMLKQKLSGVLSIKNQLTGEQFEKILVKCEANKLKMGDILTKINDNLNYSEFHQGVPFLT